MMNYKKQLNIYLQILTAFIFAVLGLYSANATAYDFQITNFVFTMGAPVQPGGPSSGVNLPGPYGTLTEGTYQGTNSTNALTNFTFFNVPVYVYTRATNQGSTNTPPDTVTGGPAPTINLINQTADLSSWFATWNGTEFNQGNNSNFSACQGVGNYQLLSPIATVTSLGNKNYQIDWNSCITGGAFNSQTGFWRLYVNCPDCPEVDTPENLTVTQDSNSGILTVGTASGNAVISSPKGVNPANTTYTWTVTPAAFTDTDSDQGTFTFDPSSVTPGIYTISHTYLDTTLTPNHIGTGTVQISVQTGLVTDFLDTDGDGVTNTYDTNSNPQQLQATLDNSSTFQLQSDIGLLALGNTAFCVSSAAAITQANIINSAGAGCTAVINGEDNQIKRIGVGGFYNFRVTGLTNGATVQVVIPLTEAIPPFATFRNYTILAGWSRFTVDTTDALASAPATSTGVCPLPSDAAYTNGLTAGNTCVRLIITDGGENDASQDGNITIQGGIAEIQSGVNASLAGGGWILLLCFPVLIGLRSISKK